MKTWSQLSGRERTEAVRNFYAKQLEFYLTLPPPQQREMSLYVSQIHHFKELLDMVLE